MNINMRDGKGNLFSKDILLMDLDMSIEEQDGKFFLRLNPQYVFDSVFSTKREAEEELMHLAEERNAREEELRDSM